MTQRDDIAALKKTIYGNGQVGLVTDMALVKDKQTEMLWWLRSLGAAVILYFVGQLLTLVGARTVIVPTVAEPKQVSATSIPDVVAQLPQIEIPPVLPTEAEGIVRTAVDEFVDTLFGILD